MTARRLARVRELIAQDLSTREAMSRVDVEMPVVYHWHLFAVVVETGEKIDLGEASPGELGVKSHCREGCPEEEHYHVVLQV